MSRPDRSSEIALCLKEEVIEAMNDTVADVVARLSPVARLRLLAFLHLLEHPEAVVAQLEVGPSGLLRLTLALLNKDGQNQPH
jgi:hypothetical protein